MTDIDRSLDAAIAEQPVNGTLTSQNGRWRLTLTRDLKQSAAQIWPMLTDPAKLAEWSPIAPARPLTSTGVTTTRESPDDPELELEVLTVDEPHLLVYRWGTDTLRWALVPTPSGTRLVLEHEFADRAECGSFGAGWHLCLAVLTARLNGHDVERVVGQRAMAYGWADLNERYAAALR